MKRKIPENCTLCGGSFEHKGKRVIYPYPHKQYLCFKCFDKSLSAGLDRLNERLAKGDIDLTVEEIAHEVGVRDDVPNISRHKRRQ